MLMADVYGSFNEAVQELWEAIAPGVPLIFGEPDPGETMPAECLRILWMEHGEADPTPGGTAGLIQLDLVVPAGYVALALERAQALDTGMGLTESASCGRVELFDDDGQQVGWADVRSLEPVWVRVPTPSLIHLARTIELFWD